MQGYTLQIVFWYQASSNEQKQTRENKYGRKLCGSGAGQETQLEKQTDKENQQRIKEMITCGCLWEFT